MIAVASLLLHVIGWEWTRDPQETGHDQGALDPGGDAPDGLQVHAPRVPKVPTDRTHLGPGGRAGLRGGGLRSLGSGQYDFDAYPRLVHTTETIWPRMPSPAWNRQ